jgi:hypothetical protein
MPTLTKSKLFAKAKWELENNPNPVTVIDPELRNGSISVDILLLIAPDEYASFLNNHRLRKLAIEQKAFKAYPTEE